jgi:hypothetical protein
MAQSASQYRAELSALPPPAVAAYLTAHSGLPGPRANLTLLDVAGDLLGEELIWDFLERDDEYLACCGVVGVGRLVFAAPEDVQLRGRLRTAAADDRWRVREAAAIAVQRIGDQGPALLRELVAAWVADPDLLVVRAAIAAICEPRLLVDPLAATAALAACEQATASLAAVPKPQRRAEAARVLRKGLAYCWSVAVAASPEAGLPQFFAINTDDPDLAWVVKQNLTKQRMRRLL